MLSFFKGTHFAVTLDPKPELGPEMMEVVKVVFFGGGGESDSYPLHC